ncbi:MAG: hypothetical protein KAS46_02340 [Candidatus Aureabacteria bacterium]|nr:hypothetical protein [Candidatus Auribacterota bacterium]
MIDKYTENEVFQAALAAFRKNLDRPVDFIVDNAAEQYLDQNVRVDRTLQINLDGKEIRFCVEIKTNINTATIGQLLNLKNQLPYPLMLVTNYTREHIANQLRQNGIEFIDTAGNAYINRPPVYIFVIGNKPPEAFIQVPVKQAFRPTGLRVVFAFLCDPNLVNKTYREIADTAGVALGNIGWIMRDLRNFGFLLEMGKHKFKLVQKEQLLNRWVVGYQEKLRPKLLIGRFEGVLGWWKQKNLNYKHAQWGGEVAAARLTKYLKPQNIIIYVKQNYLKDLVIANRLKKDIHGETEIFKCFWKQIGQNEFQDIVHPILVYADLMATGDRRNIETARMIYEQHIFRYIKED